MKAPILALFIVLTTHASAQETQGVTGEGPSVAKQQAQQSNDGSSGIAKTGLPVTIVETPGQSSHATEREEKADQHDAADLDAQVRAANAAERGAATAERQEVPAWAQIIIGAASTLIAVIALIISVWTAITSIRTTRAQLRAYVCLEGVTAPTGFEAEQITAVAHVKNFGATPASKMSQWTLIKLREYPLVGDLEPFDSAGHPNQLVLPPSAITLSMPTHRALEAWEITAMKKEELALYVYGQIDYLDAFGSKRSTKFRMRSTGEQAFKLGVFKATKEDNSYT
ncbi:hypothetical protein [Mesorhizobium sp. M0239]|uniref:hypothetical protein n=1 Tax=Mesorhizobium sp. M0239 TaxID=2956924 RepID=UPI00333BA183